MTFANILDPDEAPHFVIQIVWHSDYISAKKWVETMNFFKETNIWKKIPSIQRVKSNGGSITSDDGNIASNTVAITSIARTLSLLTSNLCFYHIGCNYVKSKSEEDKILHLCKADLAQWML